MTSAVSISCGILCSSTMMLFTRAKPFWCFKRLCVVIAAFSLILCISPPFPYPGVSASEAQSSCPAGFDLRGSECVAPLSRVAVSECPEKTERGDDQLCHKTNVLPPLRSCPEGYKEKLQSPSTTSETSNADDGIRTDGVCVATLVLTPEEQCPDGYALRKTLPDGAQNDAEQSCQKDEIRDVNLTCRSEDTMTPDKQCLHISYEAPTFDCPAGSNGTSSYEVDLPGITAACETQYKLPASAECPIGLSLVNSEDNPQELRCLERSSIPADALCPPGYQHHKNQCFIEFYRKRVLTCPEGFELIHNFYCQKLILTSAERVKCDEGWTFDVEQQLCTITYSVEPQSRCPPGSTLSLENFTPRSSSVAPKSYGNRLYYPPRDPFLQVRSPSLFSPPSFPPSSPSLSLSMLSAPSSRATPRHLQEANSETPSYDTCETVFTQLPRAKCPEGSEQRNLDCIGRQAIKPTFICKTHEGYSLEEETNICIRENFLPVRYICPPGYNRDGDNAPVKRFSYPSISSFIDLELPDSMPNGSLPSNNQNVSHIRNSEAEKDTTSSNLCIMGQIHPPLPQCPPNATKVFKSTSGGEEFSNRPEIDPVDGPAEVWCLVSSYLLPLKTCPEGTRLQETDGGEEGCIATLTVKSAPRCPEGYMHTSTGVCTKDTFTNQEMSCPSYYQLITINVLSYDENEMKNGQEKDESQKNATQQCISDEILQPVLRCPQDFTLRGDECVVQQLDAPSSSDK